MSKHYMPTAGPGLVYSEVEQTPTESIGAIRATDHIIHAKGDGDYKVSVLGMVVLIILLLAVGIFIIVLIDIIRDKNEHSGKGFDPLQCIVIKKLPYNMNKNATCYRFKKDHLWEAANLPALVASGIDMDLYCQRHRIGFTNQHANGLLVWGTQGVSGPDAPYAGSIRLHNCNFIGTTFIYPNTAYAMTVETGGTLELDHTTVANFSFAINNYNGLLISDNLNCTAYNIEDSADRLAAYNAEELSFFPMSVCFFLFGGGKTVLKRTAVHYDKLSAGGESTPGAILNAALVLSHTADPCEDLLCNPGILEIDGFTFEADAGIIDLRSRGAIMRNIMGKITPDLAAPNQLGMLIGCGSNQEAIVEGVVLDMTEAGYASGGIRVFGTTGVQVDRAIVFGQALAGWDFLNEVPYFGQHGLFDVAVFDDTPYTLGAWFSNFDLNATDETYAITVGNAAISVLPEFEDECNPNIDARFSDGIVNGGAVGLLVGTHAGQQVVSERVKFSHSTAGAYVKTGAAITTFRECSFFHHCAGITTEVTAGDIFSHQDHFSHNSNNIDDAGTTVVQLEDIAGANTNVTCTVPLFLDACEIILLGLTAENYTETAAQYGQVPPTMNVPVQGSLLDDIQRRMDTVIAANTFAVSRKRSVKN
jgi:hypothetical protein